MDLKTLESLIDLMRAKGATYIEFEDELGLTTKIVLGPAPAAPDFFKGLDLTQSRPPGVPTKGRSIGLTPLYDHPSLGLDDLVGDVRDSENE